MAPAQLIRVRWMGIALLAFLLTCVLPARGAFAENKGVDSIEWMVADSDLVIRGRLVEYVVNDDRADGHPWNRAVIEVTQTYKGTPAGRVAVRCFADDSELQEWLSSGAERHVFLVGSDRYRDDAPLHAPGIERYPYRLRNRWKLDRDHFPVAGTVPEEIAFTMDGKILATPEKIEAAIVKAAAYSAAPIKPSFPPGKLFGSQGAWIEAATPNCLHLEAPYGSDASNFNIGGAFFLTVPFDARIEQLAYDKYDPRRHYAIDGWPSLPILRHFKSERGIALFKNEMNSTAAQSDGSYDGPGMTWQYFIRQFAFDTLTAWGVAVPRPVLSDPYDSYRPLGMPLTIAVSSVVALVIGATLLLARRRARSAPSASDEPARRAVAAGESTRSHLTRASWDVACAALVVLACAALYLRIESRSTWREITFTGDRARYWLWTVDGSVTFAQAERWPVQAVLSMGAFPVAVVPPERRAIRSTGWPKRTPPTTRGRFGFLQTTGSMTAHSRSADPAIPAAPSPYVSFAAPLSAVAAFFGFVPAMRALAAILRRLRIRRRRARGQCVACGYDLRGGNDRCPECGVPPAGTLESGARGIGKSAMRSHARAGMLADSPPS